jgi:uncharacterized RDD family membrane protein YckC
MTPLPIGHAPLETPGLRRRLACLLYEGVLLFGVVMIAGLAWGVLTQQRHALVGQHGLQAVIFIVLGVYFTWFWSRKGQTLAMQTWHIRVVMTDGGPLTRGRALCRYLLAWLWFLPALLILWLTGPKSGSTATAVLLGGMLGYAALARLHPSRQYLHDRICGSRLVTFRPTSGAGAVRDSLRHNPHR